MMNADHEALSWTGDTSAMQQYENAELARDVCPMWCYWEFTGNQMMHCAKDGRIKCKANTNAFASTNHVPLTRAPSSNIQD